MKGIWRLFLLVCLALLAPIVPFLLFGGALESQVNQWLSPPPPDWQLALLTVALLATDILLPVPSSLISTLAKTFGRAIAHRFCRPDDLVRLDRFGQIYGAWTVVATRALPVLAEAAVFVVGLTELSWRRFLPAMMLSNLGIALVYALLGHFARSQGALALALAASIALPLLAATMTRWLLPATASH
jgi:membrane protein DedA with SNARE-associated domain